MQEIHGYHIQTPLCDKDAGMSQWAFAEKDGINYFLKKYLYHYPYGEEKDEMTKQMIAECKIMEEKKRRFYDKVNQASDGNVVRVQEYFRSGADYYTVTEWIDNVDISMQDLQQRPLADRLLLCKTLAHSMMCLHAKNIVHADLKKENILLAKTPNNRLVTKVIDYDEGFFSYEAPKDPENLRGDFVYFAPESLLFIYGNADSVDEKIDVFAMGLMMHQYLSGEMPSFDGYQYACEFVADGNELALSEKITPPCRNMLKNMLVLDPKKRFNAKQVFDALQGIKHSFEDYYYCPTDTFQGRK